MVQLLDLSSYRRRKRRVAFLWFFALVGLVATFWLAKDPVVSRYQIWKKDRALAQARKFVEARDALSAQLALDVAIKAAPGNLETLRVAAEILEQVGAPQAVRLRRAVTLLAPSSSEDAARLVLSSLRFGDMNSARDALAAASPETSAELPMKQAALAFALTAGDTPVADALLRDLRKQFPDDLSLRHAQNALYLRHPSEVRRAEAVRELEELARLQPSSALQIARQLAGAALERQDYVEARRRLDAVLALGGAEITDRLSKANIELLIDKQEFGPIFAEVATLGARSVADASQLLRWLVVQRRHEEAEAWIRSLPAKIREERGFRAVEAEMLAQMGEWDRLTPLLEAGVWGAIPAEALRLAMSARVVDAQNNRSLRTDIWAAAIQASGGSLSAFNVLHRLAVLWSWETEIENTLWTVVRAFPDQSWAHRALFNAYRSAGNTSGLRDLLGVLRQSDGSVQRYRHDWALLSLLREPSPLWNLPKETMKELYDSNRSSAVYATGYAFALAQAEKPVEAMSVIAGLSADDLNFPPRLPYLAFVHGVARRPQDVARLAALSEPSIQSYLPEERRLFQQAAEIAVRPPARPKVRREPRLPAASAPAAESKPTSEPAPTNP